MLSRSMFTPPTSLTARLLMLLFLLWIGAASAQSGGKSMVVTERTSAELLAHAPEGIGELASLRAAIEKAGYATPEASRARTARTSPKP